MTEADKIDALRGTAVLTEDIHANYSAFFNDAIATGCVWGLQSDDGWAQCASEKYQDAVAIPFWSQPEYAGEHSDGEWANYEPVAIALEEFLDDWLPGMHQDVLLVGINWNRQLEGDETEPLDLLQEFEGILSQG